MIRLALDVALTFSRAAVFFMLQKKVLKGRSGRGAQLGEDAIRNLWIPVSTSSSFRSAIDARAAQLAPYGSAIADGLFRATVGSRGGLLGLAPVEVAGKVVGVLACDGVEGDGLASLDGLAHATGLAFERIILKRKACPHGDT